MHDVDLHDRMSVPDAPSHGAHVFAIDEDSDAQRLDDLLDKDGDQMGGAFLIRAKRKSKTNHGNSSVGKTAIAGLTPH
jgi:hypothetical protein